MKITDNMRAALIALTAGYSDGEELHQATLEGLQRRGLATNPNGEWKPTRQGRDTLAAEFRRRREAITEPPGWDGPYRYWTRERLGEEIGVSETAVYMWESGRRPIKPITWTALRYAELTAYSRWGLLRDFAAAIRGFGGSVKEATEALSGILQAIEAADIPESAADR